MMSESGRKKIGWADLVTLKPSRASLLVVDDDPRVRDGLTRLLTGMGHQVRSAASAEEADRWLASERFQVALLDIDLPRMSGVEFLSWALTRDPELAVIMITGNDDVDLALRCIEAGARTYLVKPLISEFLRSAVDDALALRHLLTAYNSGRGL